MLEGDVWGTGAAWVGLPVYGFSELADLALDPIEQAHSTNISLKNSAFIRRIPSDTGLETKCCVCFRRHADISASRWGVVA